MGHQGYLAVEGTSQGKFKGEGIREKWKGKIEFIEFAYELSAPRDVATGQASGKRQHKPVVITKQWGAATPQLFQACAQAEVLKTVTFEFVSTSKAGEEEVSHKITLTNATVSNIKQYTSQSAKHESSADMYELEDVSFTFEAISLEAVLHKTQATDSWVK